MQSEHNSFWFIELVRLSAGGCWRGDGIKRVNEVNEVPATRRRGDTTGTQGSLYLSNVNILICLSESLISTSFSMICLGNHRVLPA